MFENIEGINKRINKKLYLIHASLNTEIKELKPRNLKYLFASDNLCCSIMCSLGHNFPTNSIILRLFCIFRYQFVFTSIAKEYEKEICNIPIKFYYCPKNKFKRYTKLGSKLSKKTFNLIKTPGYEYITTDYITPTEENIVSVDKLFNYGIHNIGDNKIKILFKAFFNLFIGINSFTKFK